ncbi:hypothetical protein Poly41_32430 [Novipirellula artificiosorum]|uniref:Uncharacterized protein n=1 Tax=Novipirellula artificiosorum TaxID=2528016 RepID=A0A5C6DQ21_9BACT|nr:hypothetical protein Poly41_32430 [Novipirellula artificiosorum]
MMPLPTPPMSWIVQLPGETEWSSAEVQLDKGHPGRRCAKGATGSRRTTVRRALFSKRSLDTGAIPPKNLESGFRTLPSDEPCFFGFLKLLPFDRVESESDLKSKSIEWFILGNSVRILFDF